MLVNETKSTDLKKILVFSTISPFPLNSADRVRLVQIVKSLSQVANVKLVYLERLWDKRQSKDVEIAGVDIISIPVSKPEFFIEMLKSFMSFKSYAVYRFASKKNIDFLKEEIDKYQPDVFWGYQTDTYPFFKCLQNKEVKKVIDLVDSISFNYVLARSQQVVSLKSIISRNTQINLDLSEIALLKESDLTIVSSLQNLQYLNDSYSSKHVYPDIKVLHGYVSDNLKNYRWQFRENREKILLFVGYLDYPPNQVAVRYIIDNVLPSISTKLPSFKFIVCGAGEEKLAEEYKDNKNVVFKGFVDDLYEQYLTANLLLSAVPFASGVQHKIIEAMAIGLPCIISQESALANGVVHGKDVLACKNPDEFVENIMSVINNPDIAIGLSTASREFVNSHHTASQQALSVQNILDGLYATKDS